MASSLCLSSAGLHSPQASSRVGFASDAPRDPTCADAVRLSFTETVTPGAVSSPAESSHFGDSPPLSPVVSLSLSSRRGGFVPVQPAAAARAAVAGLVAPGAVYLLVGALVVVSAALGLRVAVAGARSPACDALLAWGAAYSALSLAACVEIGRAHV